MMLGATIEWLTPPLPATMRCAVKEIRIAGRNTQGVRIKKLSGSEKVVSVIKIEDNIY